MFLEKLHADANYICMEMITLSCDIKACLL